MSTLICLSFKILPLLEPRAQSGFVRQVTRGLPPSSPPSTYLARRTRACHGFSEDTRARGGAAAGAPAGTLKAGGRLAYAGGAVPAEEPAGLGGLSPHQRQWLKKVREVQNKLHD